VLSAEHVGTVKKEARCAMDFLFTFQKNLFFIGSVYVDTRNGQQVSVKSPQSAADAGTAGGGSGGSEMREKEMLLRTGPFVEYVEMPTILETDGTEGGSTLFNPTFNNKNINVDVSDHEQKYQQRISYINAELLRKLPKNPLSAPSTGSNTQPRDPATQWQEIFKYANEGGTKFAGAVNDGIDIENTVVTQKEINEEMEVEKCRMSKFEKASNMSHTKLNTPFSQCDTFDEGLYRGRDWSKLNPAHRTWLTKMWNNIYINPAAKYAMFYPREGEIKSMKMKRRCKAKN